MSGPTPKPAHLRQRRNKKSGAAELSTPETPKVAPGIPNPDDRLWHALTLKWWANVWASPMAGQYLETDIDGLGRVAVLIDTYYKMPQRSELLAEIRLQEARFGLSPLDRSRLQWEIVKAEEAERRRAPKPTASTSSKKVSDPRKVLRAVK